MLLRRLAPSVLLALAIVVSTAHPASANYFDPTSQVKGIVQNFYPTAQAWAYRLYSLLLIFELFALAVTAILFRNNIGEFIAGVALKVVLGSVFLYFVANGQTFFQDVVNGFSSAGMQAGGSNAQTPLELAAAGIVAGGAFFDAAEKAHDADVEDLNVNLLYDTCYNGEFTIFCPFGPVAAAQKGNTTFEYIADGLGMTLIVTFCAIQLQLIVITIESYIVMFAGVFFIGFAGSRFTMPFSQGYFNYMISVGVKLFTTYLIAGVVSSMLIPILGAALVALVLVGLPDGVGANAALAPAALATFESMMAAALIWAIPNYASAFLSGQSSASASSLLSQVANSVGTMKTVALDAARHAKSGHNGGHGAAANAQGAGANNVSHQPPQFYDMAPSGTQTTDVFAGTGRGGMLQPGGGFGDPFGGGGSGGALGNLGGGVRPSQGNGMQSNGATANPIAMTGFAPEPKLRLSNPDPRAEG